MKSSTTTTSSNGTLTTSNSGGTLTTSNSGGTLTTSYNGNIKYVTTGYSFTTSKYHILGEDFESNGYLDGINVVMISTLNILGRPFYEELKKNNVPFPDDMDKFIQQRLKVLERDLKIESIIN